MKFISFKNVLFLVFLCLPLGISAQYSGKGRAGSAYSLEDPKTYVLTVFISETEWEYQEKKKIFDKIYEAQGWLVKQAKLYNKTISFEGGNYGLKETVILDNIMSGHGTGKEPTDWVSKILKKIGYKSPLDFGKWVKENTQCNNYLVLIIANKPGRSYAMPYSNDLSKEMYFVEGCILYTQYEDGQLITSASIVHEFLHLFGAWDLYENFMQTKDREAKARKLYPNDIMLRVSYNINELELGKLSAWLVGLHKTEEKIFNWFKPK